MLEGGGAIGHTQSGNRFITDKNKAERKYTAKSEKTMIVEDCRKQKPKICKVKEFQEFVFE